MGRIVRNPLQMKRLLVTLAVLLATAPLAHAGPAERLAAEAERTGAWVNTDQYTPTVFDVWQSGSWGYLHVQQQGWQDENAGPIRETWGAVALPDYFAQSAGADAEAILRYYGPEHEGTYGYCEFWGFNWTWWAGPTARWGGCGNLPESTTARAWPYPLGTQASGLAFIPGLLTVQDWQQRRIDHEIQVVVPEACGTYLAPANRSDGGESPRCIEYGTLLRLPTTVDLSGLSPLVRMVGEAAKTYGLRISDQSHCCIVVRAENWQRKYAPWAWGNGGAPMNPYGDMSWDDRLLRGFPWADLVEA